MKSDITSILYSNRACKYIVSDDTKFRIEMKQYFTFTVENTKNIERNTYREILRQGFAVHVSVGMQGIASHKCPARYMGAIRRGGSSVSWDLWLLLLTLDLLKEI